MNLDLTSSFSDLHAVHAQRQLHEIVTGQVFPTFLLQHQFYQFLGALCPTEIVNERGGEVLGATETQDEGRVSVGKVAESIGEVFVLAYNNH
mgnify:FL=1